MKKLLLFCGLLLALSTFGQTPYLNVIKRIAHNSRPSFEIVGNTYYVFNNINTNYQTMDYVQMDTNAVILNRLTYSVDSSQLPSNCPKCLEYKNGVLYHAYTDVIPNIPGSDTIAVVLSKVKPDLSDTIVTQYYYPTNSKGFEIRDLEFDTDSTFIITGNSGHYRYNNPSMGYKYKTLVARLDTNFNVIWENNVLDYDPNRLYGLTPEDILIDSYGSILITGTPGWTGVVFEAFAMRIRPIDGQLMWREVYLGNHGIQGMNAVDNMDGTYTYVQSWKTSNDPRGFLQLHIGIIDTAGNLITDTAVGPSNGQIIANDLIRLNDGNLFCAGTRTVNYGRGFGFKFSPNLDSLWFQTYRHPSINQHHWLELFLQDSTGMIVNNGWTVQNGVDNWLFRIDTRGCTVSNCDISIDEYTQLDTRWKGFPIPSTGPLTIDHPELASFKSVAIQVFDLAGRKVYAELHDCAQPISINIEAPGQYQVLVGDHDLNAIGMLKIVVQ